MTDHLRALKGKIDDLVENARRQRNEKDRQFLMSNIGHEIAQNLVPLMHKLSDSTRLNKEDFTELVLYLKKELADIQPTVHVEAPRVEVPEIKIPEIRVPDVHVPRMEWPEGPQTIEGWVRLQGVDLGNPLPVQIRDKDGKPVNLIENLTQIVGGGRVGLTDSQLRASAVPISAGSTLDVKQVSGSVDSVNVVTLPVAFNQGDTEGRTLRVIHAGDSGVSVTATQTGTWTVTTASGSLATVTGDIVSDDVDTSTAPVKIGGIARTANPTAVGGGDRVSASYDDLGRQLIRPVQVRDLIQTAYVSVTTGTETTLLAGVAGVFFDLLHAIGTNNSDAAVTVDFRSATGGGIVTSVRVPANGTGGAALTVPIPQDVAADTWTVDLPDITGTTVTISALFSREV